MFFNFNEKSHKSDSKQEKTTPDGPKCPRCGNIGRAGAIYCDQCGVRIQMIPKPNRDTEITQELPIINLSN